jgi:hypothetical protein
MITSNVTDQAATDSAAPVVLLLTATVDVRGVAFMERRDPTVRLDDYKRALKAWLSTPNVPPLVFAENSGYPTDDLAMVVQEHANRAHVVEFLSFDDNNYPRTLGKGFGELRTIRYALDNSRLIGDDTLVVKVTGRHYVPNIGDVVASRNGSHDVDVYCDLRGNLTWADTRFFCARTRFIRDFFLPMESVIDDTAGVTIEHALGRAAHLAMSQGRGWSMFRCAPRIHGISGTADFTYPDSRVTHYKQELFRALKTAVLAR